MNEGDHVVIVVRVPGAEYLIGRRGVVMRVMTLVQVKVEGQHPTPYESTPSKRWWGRDTYFLTRSEIRPLSALEQLAGVGDEWLDASI